jgi:hypothetical protein
MIVRPVHAPKTSPRLPSKVVMNYRTLHPSTSNQHPVPSTQLGSLANLCELCHNGFLQIWTTLFFQMLLFSRE